MKPFENHVILKKNHEIAHYKVGSYAGQYNRLADMVTYTPTGEIPIRLNQGLLQMPIHLHQPLYHSIFSRTLRRRCSRNSRADIQPSDMRVPETKLGLSELRITSLGSGYDQLRSCHPSRSRPWTDCV
ncbi:hypothetical protein TNCV_879231 [Trichonephila clavipes]|nr:hypothetical protein TNCV_879231 [Trichonephila clavipes]